MSKVKVELEAGELEWFLVHSDSKSPVDAQLRAALAAHRKAEADAELGLPWEAHRTDGVVEHHWSVRCGDGWKAIFTSEAAARLAAAAPDLADALEGMLEQNTIGDGFTLDDYPEAAAALRKAGRDPEQT